jgi:outer membrane protein
MWSYDPTGQIRNSPDVANDTFSLENDLGMQDDETFQGFLYFEHPVPIIPNFRLGVTNLQLTGNGTTTSVKNWNGTAIPAGNVITDADLSHTELGLYYELWDTGFDFDLGINVKLFNGSVTMSGGGATATSSFEETVPLLYGHFGIPLVAGFNIAADISGGGYDGNNYMDSLIRVGWVSDFMLGVELGYRSMTVDYSDGNEYADVKIKGPYLSATLTF